MDNFETSLFLRQAVVGRRDSNFRDLAGAFAEIGRYKSP